MWVSCGPLTLRLPGPEPASGLGAIWFPLVTAGNTEGCVNVDFAWNAALFPLPGLFDSLPIYTNPSTAMEAAPEQSNGLLPAWRTGIIRALDLWMVLLVTHTPAQLLTRATFREPRSAAVLTRWRLSSFGDSTRRSVAIYVDFKAVARHERLYGSGQISTDWSDPERSPRQ